MTKSSCIVRLMYDEAAPTEVGGGFHLVRKKFDPYDTSDVIPTRIQFWFAALGGELNWGWTFRDEQNPQSSKQVAIMERRIKVANLLAAKKEQKEIAALLDVHAATVCRDIAAIQAQATATRTASVDQEKVSQENALSSLEEEWGATGGHEVVVNCLDPAQLDDAKTGQPHAQFEIGRGVGTVPVNRNGDESLHAELTALEHEQSHFTESPPPRQQPSRLKTSPTSFLDRKPPRRRPTRGIGAVQVNRTGDESAASELNSLGGHSVESLDLVQKAADSRSPSIEPPWWESL